MSDHGPPDRISRRGRADPGYLLPLTPEMHQARILFLLDSSRREITLQPIILRMKRRTGETL